MNDGGLHRYHRQMLLPGFGAAGQRRLRSMHALVVGCGALGTFIVDALARAGVGVLTIVDRDVVELTNLQRQVLFDESDLAASLPKAEAARLKVARINSEVVVQAAVEDFTVRNAERLCEGADIIMDGLDNFQARYLLNDLAVARGIPYIYGGAVGTTGVSLPILPHLRHRRGGGGRISWSDADATPCLRCVFPEAPPPGSSPTCDTAGVLGPVVAMIAAHQAAQALKLMTDNVAALDRGLLSLDAWTNESRRFDVARAREATQCPCCVEGRFDFLDAATVDAETALCGRGAVQVAPKGGADDRIDLDALLVRLQPHGEFERKAYVLRGIFAHERGGDDEAIELTLFADGRALVKGVEDPAAARAIYARYIGA